MSSKRNIQREDMEAFMDRTRPEFSERFREELGTGVFYVPVLHPDRDAFRALALDIASQMAERSFLNQDAGPVAQYMVQILASRQTPVEKHFLHPLPYYACYELGQQATMFLWVPSEIEAFSSLVTVECPGFGCTDDDSAWACHRINPCSCQGGSCQ